MSASRGEPTRNCEEEPYAKTEKNAVELGATLECIIWPDRGQSIENAIVMSVDEYETIR
jgi:hypothetical protein